MQIVNVSKYRIPFGGVSLDPEGGTVVLDEMPTGRPREILEELVEVGYLKVSDPGEDEEPIQDPEPVPEPMRTDEDADTVPIEVPQGFAKWHTNKAKAWVKKQDDLVLLKTLATVDERPKVVAALDARIEELEARP